VAFPVIEAILIGHRGAQGLPLRARRSRIGPGPAALLYMHMTSITLRGAQGTTAVLLAISAVVVAQLVFTYAPFMHALFESRPVTFVDGVLIVFVGAVLMLILEGEKTLMRRIGVFDELRSWPAERTAPI
jgi:hypothetical protein